MRPLPVTFRVEALADLRSISDYISRHDPVAAARTIQRIHRVVFKTLAFIPQAGRLDARNGAREFPAPGLPYLVIYVETGNLIDVIGVFHTSRDPGTKPRP